MNPPYCVVLTTTNNPKTTNRLIDAVLKQKLAACVQCIEIDSHYLWQDEVCRDKETLLVIKSTEQRYLQLQTLICELHDYDTPQVVKIPFSEGASPYLAWLKQSTQ